MLVFHNAKYDLNIMRHMGLNFEGKTIWCTMICDYLLHGQNTSISYSLNAVAARYGLGQKVDEMAEYWNNGYETDQIPWDLHQTYLRQDVNLTHLIFQKQFPQVKKTGLSNVAWLSMELSRVLSDMESTGIPFDKDGAEKYVDEYSSKLENLDRQIFDIAGQEFKVSSSDQLSAIMYGGKIKREVQELVARARKNGTFRISTRKAVYEQTVKGLGFTPEESAKSKKTGKASTGKKALMWLRWETPEQERMLQLLSERSNAQKVYSTLWSDNNETSGLIRQIGVDGRIHPSFNQTFTRTGRLSSSNPNSQNFPRGNTSPLKKLIRSKRGYILNADLSQIEWRTAAALSEDSLMCDEINHGFDVHTDSAQRFFDAKGDTTTKAFKKVRTTAKIFNFRMLYNGKPKAFFYDPTMPRFPLTKWKKIVPGFYEKYHELRDWQLNNEKIVNIQNYLRNPSGRFLTFDYNTEDDEKPTGYNLNAICNYPVQSISADLMFLAMITIYRKVKASGAKADLLMQVHDSLVWDVAPEDVFRVGRICEDVFDSLPRLSREFFGWDIPVVLEGEVGLGLDYGTMLEEYKTHQFTQEAVDKFLKENPATPLTQGAA